MSTSLSTYISMYIYIKRVCVYVYIPCIETYNAPA
jgi:hypothetical protein